MFYADNEHQKSYVITYKELIFTFMVFSTILFVLYPKDLLKEQILSENSNYDLSMLYLENLLKHSPEDESLMLILAEQSLRSGKKDLSLRLLQLLLKSKNQEYKYRATLLSYDLEKEDYYYFKDKDKKNLQKEKLRKLFITIYFNKMYKEEAAEIDKWYKESMFIHIKEATYFFVKKKLKKEPHNIHYLEQAYYLSKRLAHPKNSLVYVKLLQKYDIERENHWILDEYYMYVNYKQYNNAQKLLLQHAKRNEVWSNRLGDFYIMRKSFKKASKVYVSLFKSLQTYKSKKKYFYKSLNALQAGNHFNDAAKLAHKYELNYIKDRDARHFILKLYLATGNLNYASSFSKKILYKELRE